MPDDVELPSGADNQSGRLRRTTGPTIHQRHTREVDEGHGEWRESGLAIEEMLTDRVCRLVFGRQPEEAHHVAQHDDGSVQTARIVVEARLHVLVAEGFRPHNSEAKHSVVLANSGDMAVQAATWLGESLNIHFADSGGGHRPTITRGEAGCSGVQQGGVWANQNNTIGLGVKLSSAPYNASTQEYARRCWPKQPGFLGTEKPCKDKASLLAMLPGIEFDDTWDKDDEDSLQRESRLMFHRLR
ncbi:hypothetical protein B0T24DRAFT_671747 [Lasiosphaeria ovina]|uniref:Uncharacterized protein n=1 Tax=Lasiosphaeria ovina TaxID=92902 RepID=A0AAE0JS19_9PEZI|nr:hypothetical protein B0T24DRAFT_671747 [Lasiosphaeria ovina]